jgi:hypothetical protein
MAAAKDRTEHKEIRPLLAFRSLCSFAASSSTALLFIKKIFATKKPPARDAQAAFWLS